MKPMTMVTGRRRIWLAGAVLVLLAGGLALGPGLRERWRLARASAQGAYRTAVGLQAEGALPRAERWYRRAAEQGHPAAAIEVGRGCEIARKDDEAVRAYLQTAATGTPPVHTSR